MRLRAALLCLFVTVAACASDDTPEGQMNNVNNVNNVNNANNVNSKNDNNVNNANNGSNTNNANNSNNANNAPDTVLEDLLIGLRENVQETVVTQSLSDGWPAPVRDGYLFVSTDPTLDKVAGDFDEWAGTQLTVEDNFAWTVLDVAPGTRYKFTDLDRWVGDPISRAYEWDENGLMSRTIPEGEAHLQRFFGVRNDEIQPRTVRVWVPVETPTHVIYVHDGQNLFSPYAINGGWRLQDSAPAAMMLVGIDNTAARMDEYTHVQDNIGELVGGRGDDYADYVNTTVRGLIEAQYGEAPKVGVMGSSLGGLISFHIADRFPNDYIFAASLSGTMGWGSIGLNNQTMIERYQAAGKRDVALYLDSGGDGTCVDSDQDGIEDDGTANDNYCENKQLEAVLVGLGYTYDVDMWHWHEPGAAHNEAAWAARVFRPLEAFGGL